MSKPLALVPTGLGINCEAETAHALTLAGATVEQPHVGDLCRDPSALQRASILALAGGFSFGDHLGGGRALAMRLRSRIGAELTRFVDDGGLVIGICNGFQVLVRLGLLPGGDASGSGAKAAQTVTLTANRHNAFYDGWVRIAFDPRSPCVFTRDLEAMDIPVRHGEGRLICAPAAAERVEREHLAVCRYVDADGAPTEAFPHNPNGSAGGLAGLCDATGRVFGLMPHPEAYLYPENHPDWRRSGARGPSGLAIFERAVAHAASAGR